MIYVMGGSMWKNQERFTDEVFNRLQKGDRLIVNGYVGLFKDDIEQVTAFLQELAKKPYYTLLVDCPPERLGHLMKYLEEDWCGGKVHVLARDEKGEPKVIHLIRGQVFEIDGKTMFVHGGAGAMDGNGYCLVWPNDRPTAKEEEQIKENFAAVDYKVDYIFTFTAPETTMMKMYPENMDTLCMSYFLEWVCENVTYKRWFFTSIGKDFDFGREQISLGRVVMNVETNEVLGLTEET